ncbi:TonB-dependent receptor [Brevundimonas sp.]|uniref:TonB-dependent receptor n=1 Tax=Brevundimonas sp. TaxID=1871086 RepID=UPI002D18B053|nr:TonB-dependent receptor [Brevundimonas sp.]HWQ86449.1 TonB-dependent receptor [Brevundimonas sp.]
MIHRVQRTNILLGATALGLVWGLAGAASAQDAEPTNLDEVIVTAQLREQSAAEVPFALTALSGETLQNLGVQDFEELSAFTPGLLVQNQSPNNPGFVMRGITSDSGEATNEPRVSVYQDGVSISKSRGSYVELFDVERIEVAKGPQSTLYGRGALIGAINVIQNKADIDAVDAAGRLAFGNLGYTMAEVMVNAPINDMLALRFSTRMKTREGYVENLLGGPDYNGFQTYAWRLGLAFQPNDAFRYDLIANYQTDEGPGTSFKAMAYSPADPTTGAVLGGRDPWDGAALTPSGTFDGGKPLGLDRTVHGVTGIGRFDFSDALTLTSTTAWREFESYEAFDPDGISLPLLFAGEDAQGKQFSQELRLNWDNGGALSGFIGAGYFNEEGFQRTPTEFNERVALAQLAGLLDGNPAAVGTTALPLAAFSSPALIDPILAAFGIPAPFIPGIRNNLKSSHTETATNSSELESFDLFGDVTWRPTDRLEFALGVRWTQDEKTTGISTSTENGRSILGGLLAVQQVQGQIAALIAQGTPAALAQAAALGAFANGVVFQLAQPGAATAPVTAAFPLFGLTFQPTAGNGSTVSQDLEDDGVTWRATARYALTDDANLYANYARGRRPAVLSPGTPAAPFAAPAFTFVDEELVDSYEVGAKTATMGGALRLDGAAYFYDYTNFQTTVQVGTQFFTTNAGEATAYGFEGQAFFSPMDSLDLFATYAYNHSRFEAGIFDGNKFRLSPDHRASVGLTWRVPLFGGEFEVQPTYSWQSETFFDNDNDRADLQTGNFVPDTAVDEVQEAYGLLNLRVRYAPSDANWGLEVFGDNLLDEQYIKDAGNTGDGLGLPTFIAGEPRTYGATLSLRY